MSGSQTIDRLDKDVRIALQAALERAITAINGNVRSPRLTLLSIKQVSDAIGVSDETIEAMVARGEFPKPIRVGGKREKKWRESTLVRWLDTVEGS